MKSMAAVDNRLILCPISKETVSKWHFKEGIIHNQRACNLFDFIIDALARGREAEFNS